MRCLYTISVGDNIHYVVAYSYSGALRTLRKRLGDLECGGTITCVAQDIPIENANDIRPGDL